MLASLETTGRAAGLGLAALLFCACASGPSPQARRNVDLLIAQRNWPAAESFVEKHKSSDYGRKNMVLYYLDLGTILHGARRYRRSDEAFHRAEQRMDELYTKSLHQAAGLLLLNDATMDYAGQPFEHALTNVYRALNYVFLGKPEDAVVEARKVEEFLSALRENAGGKDVYKDDAFARLLDSLLYEDLGQNDDARISLHFAKKAYRQYEGDYRMPPPAFPLAYDLPQDGGELVFLHFNGIVPRKVSRTFQVAWGNALMISRQNNTDEENAKMANALRAGVAGRAITVSYPAYVQDPFSIRSSEVVVDSGTRTAATSLVEPIGAIARKTLADELPLIEARSIARATLKFVLAEAASRAADRLADRELGRGSLADVAARFVSRGLAFGAAAATESADTRDWSTLPAQIRMARLDLPAGRHDVEVRFLDAQGQVVSSVDFKDVDIQKSKRTYLSYRTAS